MMYLIKSNLQTGRTTEHGWHVGEPSPFKLNPDLAQFVNQVQADGDELEYVIMRFEGLPHVGRWGVVPGGRVQRWYGDYAKFIARNL